MDADGKDFRLRLNQAMQHGKRKEVAERLGITPETISRWGKKVNKKTRFPSLWEAYVTAEVCGIDVCWLSFGRSTVKTQAENHWLQSMRELQPEQRATLIELARQLGSATAAKIKTLQPTPAPAASRELAAPISAGKLADALDVATAEIGDIADEATTPDQIRLPLGKITLHLQRLVAQLRRPGAADANVSNDRSVAKDESVVKDTR